MSTPTRKGFSQFLRQPSQAPVPDQPQPKHGPATIPASPADPEPAPGRIRRVTSTGRVRTHVANRDLPGVTLRLNEERWERLKILSVHERRPIQEILGEAVAEYMDRRGLPW
jgi:hypothetical protein